MLSFFLPCAKSSYHGIEVQEREVLELELNKVLFSHFLHTPQQITVQHKPRSHLHVIQIQIRWQVTHAMNSTILDTGTGISNVREGGKRKQ